MEARKQHIIDQIEQVYRKSYGALLVYAKVVTGDLDWAKDGVQDAMLSLLKNVSTIKDTENLFPYVLQAVKNKCLARLTSYERRIKRESIYTVDMEVFDSFEFEFRGGQFLDFCLKNLTPQQSKVVQMQFIENMAQKDIASQLGITEGAVVSSKYYAMLSIKRYVKTGKFRDDRVQKRQMFNK